MSKSRKSSFRSSNSIGISSSSAGVGGAREALDAVRKIVRGLNVSSRACEKKWGLTSAQLFVLQKLREFERLSINELAEHTLTHQSTVSEVVGRLVARGLVARRASDEDKRRSELTLTREGEKFVRRQPKSAQEKLIEGFQALTPQVRGQLVVALTDWVERSGLGETAPAMFFEEPKKGK